MALLKCFMNVEVDGKAGDFVDFIAQMDLIVGLTACSAEQSNNYRFKPIAYELHPE